MKKNNKIIIQDTTLRDGEQTPYLAFNFSDKVKIIKALIEIGVDVIEIGFPAASIEEKNIIKKISQKFVGANVRLCVFSRALEEDILIANEAIKNYENKKIQIVSPSSDSHIKYSVNKNKDQIISELKNSIILAKKYFKDIQFTAQDAPRAEKKFLYQLIKTAIDLGAKTICLPDTVGYCSPNEYRNLILEVKKLLKNKKNVIIAAHCHNDLGLATANTLAAIEAGALQFECTTNGLGERAGNTPLEEVLAILDLKNKKLLSKKVKLNLLKKTSLLIEKISNINISDNKPILGKNVFMHASGMHQKAVLKKKETFEVLDANKFGLKGAKIAMGKLSGRSALKKILKDNKIKLDENKMNHLMQLIKKEALIKKKLNFFEIRKLLNLVNINEKIF